MMTKILDFNDSILPHVPKTDIPLFERKKISLFYEIVLCRGADRREKKTDCRFTYKPSQFLTPTDPATESLRCRTRQVAGMSRSVLRCFLLRSSICILCSRPP